MADRDVRRLMHGPDRDVCAYMRTEPDRGWRARDRATDRGLAFATEARCGRYGCRVRGARSLGSNELRALVAIEQQLPSLRRAVGQSRGNLDRPARTEIAAAV